MDYLTQHWSFDPYLVVAAAVAVVHEAGLHHLARRSTPDHALRRRRRAWLLYAGLVLLVVTVSSPVEYWSYRYFFVHVVGHILVAFFVPILVVAGAPWLPLVHALPVGVRRRALRAVHLGRHAGAWRAVGRFVASPWTALVSFNVAMVFWHLPGPFDLAQTDAAVHTWLMYGSLLLTGVLFWLQIVPSHPFRVRMSGIWQIGAILSTNVVMFVLAMAMSILTQQSWYDVYRHVPGVTLSPFADQQIGAAILWVCGDFWAAPALAVVIKRAIDQQGSISDVLDAIVRRGPEPTAEALWAPAGAGGGPVADGDRAERGPAGAVGTAALPQEGCERVAGRASPPGQTRRNLR